VKAREFPRSQIATWRQSAFDVLTADVVAGRNPGPNPADEWAPALHQLCKLSRKPVSAPSWWTPMTGYFGSVETRTDPSGYYWDGMKRLGRNDAPLFAFQLTLGGWGHFQLYGQPPRRVTPGTAFIAVMPSRHRYCLPKESPGWTFGWISVYHPYVLERMKKLVSVAGPLIDVVPDGPLAAIALRLMRGAIKKDYRDRFEVELALFEFLVACEQSVQKARDNSGEGEKLVKVLGTRVLASLPHALDVTTLAAEHGMSRTHFSHFFKARTGNTPAHFATEVRIAQAVRLLVQTELPLKQIAVQCGFANANYFCKVFRRCQHMSPLSYRRAFR